MLVKCTEVDPTLSPVEKQQIAAYVLQVINIWQSIEIAYANGMVSQETYGTVEDDARLMVQNYPGTSPFLQQILEGYPALSESGVFKIIKTQIEKQKDHAF